MPRASKVIIKKDIAADLDEYFVSLISSLSNPGVTSKFFEDFLTREEKLMLTKRLMIHLMLENEYSPSEIQSVLGVSRETVRTHQAIWARSSSVYKNIIKKIAKKERAKKFWAKVNKILTPFDLALRSGTDMRARAKIYSGNWFDER